MSRYPTNFPSANTSKEKYAIAVRDALEVLSPLEIKETAESLLFGGTMFINKCEHSECCTMPGGICEFKEVFSEATEFLNQHFGKVVFKGWIQ